MSNLTSKRRNAIFDNPLPDDVVSQIAGNAPREIKELPVKWLAMYHQRTDGFANTIGPRIIVSEVSVIQNVEDSEKIEGKVVCEIGVTEDMLGRTGTMHEGCMFFLIDECSALSLAVLNAAEGRPGIPGVSQTINAVFHASATLGTKLRIVNISMTAGDDMTSCRSEIWDPSKHRLVATGVQTQMMPKVKMWGTVVSYEAP